MAPVEIRKIGTGVQGLAEEVRRRLGSTKAKQQDQRWLAVTVEGEPARITTAGELPAPLARLGSSVEVEIRPGPGDWGTEIFARPAVGSSTAAADGDVRGQIRSALRQTKQLLEVGEVLIAEPRPEGPRPATVAGKLVDRAVRNADEKGVL
jgi:hypothetical protein